MSRFTIDGWRPFSLFDSVALGMSIGTSIYLSIYVPLSDYYVPGGGWGREGAGLRSAFEVERTNKNNIYLP